MEPEPSELKKSLLNPDGDAKPGFVRTDTPKEEKEEVA